MYDLPERTEESFSVRMPNIETIVGNAGESLQFAGDIEEDEEDQGEVPAPSAIGERGGAADVFEYDVEGGEGPIDVIEEPGSLFVEG